MGHTQMWGDHEDGSHFFLALEWKSKPPQVALSTPSCLAFACHLAIIPCRLGPSYHVSAGSSHP